MWRGLGGGRGVFSFFLTIEYFFKVAVKGGKEIFDVEDIIVANALVWAALVADFDRWCEGSCDDGFDFAFFAEESEQGFVACASGYGNFVYFKSFFAIDAFAVVEKVFNDMFEVFKVHFVVRD